MNIQEFIETNIDKFVNLHSGGIGGSVFSGEELYKMKNTILSLDEFLGVKKLNILSKPQYKSKSDGTPKSKYLFVEKEVLIEKKQEVDNIVFSNAIDNGVIRFNMSMPDDMKTCDSTCFLENMLSNVVDLFSISLTTAIYNPNVPNDLGEGVWKLQNRYNPNTYNIIKEIRIIYEDSSLDDTEFEKNIIKTIKKEMKENTSNMTATFGIMLRVSDRSIVKDDSKRQQIQIKLNERKIYDKRNNIK